MRKIIQRRSEQAWRELVARQVQSGLSVQEFCQREGINAYSLYGWRSRLRAGGASEEPAVSRPAQAEPTAEFIDLGALGPSRSRCEVRLDLGGGVMLHLVRS
jgi:transposase-like protein